MAKKAKRICSYPGCNTLVDAGRCEKHKRQYDMDRGSAASRGYDDRWRRYRRVFLTGHPFCVECLKEGKYEPATDVDHIKPVDGQSDPLFWDPKNHQALCHSHHSKKTVKENGGFGNGRS